jgi:D-alanyl-lipoteichoic acid acyltransferase DltB (MBOAT superfamily)
MPVSSQPFAATLAELGAVIALRTLPVMSFALLARQVAGRARATLAIVLVSSIIALAHWNIVMLGWLLASYSYFAVLTYAARLVSEHYRHGRITAGAAFAFAAVGYFVVPAVVVGPGGYSPLVLGLGWDMMLSCYSYCIDASRQRSQPPLRECLHFVLVNPALVYAERGTVVGPPRVSAQGLLRIVIGLAALAFATVVLQPAHMVFRQLASPGSPRGLSLATSTAMLTCGVIRFILQYTRQAGLASLQIGILRQFGHVLPERYVAPWQASDPADFFRRWNTYVSHWLQRYVFWPLSLGLSRGRIQLYRVGAMTGALLATFLVCGLLHEAALYAAAVAAPGPMLKAFATGGVVVVAWHGMSRGWLWLKGRLSILSPLDRFAGSMSRMVLWTAIAGVFFRWFA